jgi:Ni,Fe-hydrogenase I cytochrome b subunit
MGGTVEIVVVVSHGSHFSSTAWRKVLAWEIILWIPGHDFIISSFHHSITSSTAQGGGGSFRIGNL